MGRSMEIDHCHDGDGGYARGGLPLAYGGAVVSVGG